ncbi:histidine phosphatase family protein [Nocardia cyriacigeorgica]|uniref:histidine phosphatase family protein n=1 Tax=Nocardia cyriacigeorgica TaxID=135487 RepID=UPI0024547554|nr:histidine phosphatase family protein [Nocardia cyriacigeorgica]
MTGKLILVRHGETEGNVARILDTSLPGLPLTQRGAAQAKTFGSRLTIPPRLLLSSQALRARQTAGFIEGATGVSAGVLDGVHEVQVGDLEGENSQEAHELFLRVYRSWHEGELAQRLPGGESGQEVLDRFLPAITDLRDGYLAGADAGDVLLVNHGAAMRLVARTLTGVAPPFTIDNHLDNTETIELAPRQDGTWECVRWGRYTPPFGRAPALGADDPMG